MVDWHWVMGPPGTGKTTRLLEIAAALPEESYALVTFTKIAAFVARERGARSPYVKTLHASAFAGLSLKRNEAMVDGAYRSVALEMGLRMKRGAWDRPEDGDRVHQARSYATARGIPIGEAVRDLALTGMNLDLALVEEFDRQVSAFKRRQGLVEFAEMLSLWMLEGAPPPVETLIIDEAQDLSPIQWEVIDWWIGHGTIRQVIAAGDDDQAIYGWAGADVAQYLRRIREGGRVEYLDHSYRCPREVYQKAQFLLSQMTDRIEKTWTPRLGDPGEVSEVGSLPDLSEGKWLILAPYGYLLRPMFNQMQASGFWYEVNGQSSLDKKVMDAAAAWEDWRLYGSRERTLASSMRKVAGPRTMDWVMKGGRPETPFWDLPDLSLSPLRLAYHRDLLDLYRGGGKAPIRFSTIHRAKGDEEDNVLVINRPDSRSADRIARREGLDDFLRTLYVGVTRSRQNLFLHGSGFFL